MGNSNTNSLINMSLVRPILEYEASCWKPYREVQINQSDRVQKKAAKFAKHTKDSVWETLVQCRKGARICALFKHVPENRPGNMNGTRLQRPCYLSRDYHDRKIMAKK